MISTEQWNLDGRQASLFALSWQGDQPPTYVAVLVHGYAEHIGRYEHVAETLVNAGAVVYGLDHLGHGRSGGERALIPDFDDVVADVDTLVDQAREVFASLPVVMIGHSMGGLIAARYAQLHSDRLCSLVLSGPAIGNFEMLAQLAELDEIPEIPIDPDVLSRDGAVGAAYAADELVYRGAFKADTVRSMLAAIERVNTGGRLDVPTMWVHGSDDQLVPIEGTKAGIDQIAGDTMVEKTYDGARHEVFNETNQQQVLADVIAFIDQHLPR